MIVNIVRGHRMMSYMPLNFSKKKKMIDGMFVQFLKTKKLKTLWLHSEMKWLSKIISLERLVIFCKQYQRLIVTIKTKLVKLERLWKNLRILR